MARGQDGIHPFHRWLHQFQLGIDEGTRIKKSKLPGLETAERQTRS
jgi:hypothetical protein